HPVSFDGVQSMLAEPAPSSYIQKYIASRGFPTAPAQFDAHSEKGNPPGGPGSVFRAAPCRAAWSRAVAIPVSGGRPRAVRSRLVATKTCCSGDSWPQLVGRTMGAKPSWLRPLAIACNVAATQVSEPSYWEPEQLWRKLGWGAMFAGRAPGASTVRAGIAGGVVGVGCAAGGAVVGVGGVGTAAGGLTGGTVVEDEGAAGLRCGEGPIDVARPRSLGPRPTAVPGCRTTSTNMMTSPMARRQPNRSQLGLVAGG